MEASSDKLVTSSYVDQVFGEIISWTIPDGILVNNQYKWRVRYYGEGERRNIPSWSSFWIFKLAGTGDFVKIDMGNNDVISGLQRPNPEPNDGKTTPLSITNSCNGIKVALRKNKNITTSPASRYFYFKVDDNFIKSGNWKRVDIWIQYWNQGGGSFDFQYDASDSAYKNAGSTTIGNDSCMKSVTYQLYDAHFGNRQNAGSDFRIYCGPGNAMKHINVVKVIKR